MELQAIREKLLSLQAEPATPDGLSAPWPSSQRSSLPVSESVYRKQLSSQSAATRSVSEDSPQAVAIKALRQRSSNPQAENLIAQEITRLEVLANNINERSQQQAAEILAIKRSAQQAAVALRRQGIHDHPGLQVIEQFLASYPSASVPLLERDSRGQFCLNHNVVNLHRAEQDASHVANTLRQRQSGNTYPETARLEKEPVSMSSIEESHVSTLFKESIDSAYEQSQVLPERRSGTTRRRNTTGVWRKLLSSVANLLGREVKKERVFEERSHRTEKRSHGFLSGTFSWTDAAIWFSGAAIARIALEATVVSFPLLRMPILLLLFSIISFSIYRVVVAKSTDMPSVYRLAITLLGLIVGGSL